MTYLSDLIAEARATTEQRKKKVFEPELRRMAARRTVKSLRAALASGPAWAAGSDAAVSLPARIIAEIKRASPSKGPIRSDLDAARQARLYAQGGAAAISVLTEQRSFMGSLDDLEKTRGQVSLPILRKDFIVDPYQVWEARARGADAVLLIVAALPETELARLLAACSSVGIEALVEVHSEAELDTALRLGCADKHTLGVNARNLDSFQVDHALFERIAPKAIAPGRVVVAESGLASREQIRKLQALGYSGFLIGETLVNAPDPVAALKQLVG